MLVIKEGPRTCYYKKVNFFVINYDDKSYYWDFCIKILKKAMKISGVYTSTPSCFIAKLQGFALFNDSEGNGLMYFNSNMDELCDFSIKLLDFTARNYEVLHNANSNLDKKLSDTFHFKKIIIIDLGGFTYKCHFIYDDNECGEQVYFLKRGKKISLMGY